MENVSARAKRARAWCFTIHATEELHLQLPCWCPFSLPDVPDLTYGVCQLESAPTTGARHIQGYAHFGAPITMSGVKRKLAVNHVHLEIARGTAAENRAYCTKEDTRVEGTEPLEHGELPQQGKRNDITTMVERWTTNGFDTSDPVDLSQLLLRPSGVRAVLAALQLPARPIDQPLQVYVLWGAPGTGKSRAVRDYAHFSSLALHVFLPPKHGNVWFDGYHGQPVALLDDFQDDVDYPLMLRLMDR